MKIIKSIGAVLVGLITLVFLSVVTDKILEASGIFPPPENGLFIPWMLALALTYRCIYQIIGGYVTAALAPDKPMKHVLILGCIGILGGIAGIVQGWDMSQHWYPITLAVLAFPTVWFGGKLRTRNANS